MGHASEYPGIVLHCKISTANLNNIVFCMYIQQCNVKILSDAWRWEGKGLWGLIQRAAVAYIILYISTPKKRKHHNLSQGAYSRVCIREGKGAAWKDKNTRKDSYAWFGLVLVKNDLYDAHFLLCLFFFKTNCLLKASKKDYQSWRTRKVSSSKRTADCVVIRLGGGREGG